VARGERDGREKQWWEAGEIRKNYSKLRNIPQSEKRKEAAANKIMAGTEIKGWGKRKV